MFSQSKLIIFQNLNEANQVLKATKTNVIDDDISKKVEKKETLAQQKEKNRVIEYLILLSADLSNNIGA